MDGHKDYFEKYSNLQYVKHHLIQEYLNGWFPKLGTWAGRIVYLDTHSGRGTHTTGQYGSPIVALRTLLDHSYRSKLLEKSEAVFVFIEQDADNMRQLRNEIAQLGPLPRKVNVKTIESDCFSAIREIIDYHKQPNRDLAPSFVFVDPYGFKIPGEILKELMSFPRVELFINLMWRELDMAIQQPNVFGSILNSIFGGEHWQEEINAESSDDRADQAVELIKRLTKSKWSTYLRMCGDNDTTRYVLLHLTDHDAGRDLMKDCVWKMCPDGRLLVRKNDNPAQGFLIAPDADFTPLREWVVAHLRIKPRRWDELAIDLRSEIWREVHLNDVIRELRNESRIQGSDYSGKFSRKANPLLSLVT